MTPTPQSVTPAPVVPGATPTPRTDANQFRAWTGSSEKSVVYADFARGLEREVSRLEQNFNALDEKWVKIIKEVLLCDPIPACKRSDDSLEPPHEVIARMRADLTRAREEAERCQNVAKVMSDCADDWKQRLLKAEAAVARPEGEVARLEKEKSLGYFGMAEAKALSEIRSEHASIKAQLTQSLATGERLRGVLEHAYDAVEKVERAHNEIMNGKYECTCYSDIDGVCVACNKSIRLRKIAEAELKLIEQALAASPHAAPADFEATALADLAIAAGVSPSHVNCSEEIEKVITRTLSRNEQLTEALRETNKFLIEEVYSETAGNELGGPQPADSLSAKAFVLWGHNEKLLPPHAAPAAVHEDTKPGLDRSVKRVLITECSISGGWYASRVGQEIDVEFTDHEGYWAREGGVYNCINKILRHNAVVTVRDSWTNAAPLPPTKAGEAEK